MTTERFGIVKFRGQAVTVLRPDLKPGDVAPEFSVQTLDWSPYITDWRTYRAKSASLRLFPRWILKSVTARPAVSTRKLQP